MSKKVSRPLDLVLLSLVRSRLFYPLLAVSLAALIVSGLLGAGILVSQQQQNVEERSRTIERYLDQADRMFDTVARVAAVSTPDETRTVMQGTLGAYRYFDTLYLLDNQSRIIRMVPPDVRYMGLDMSSVPSYRMTGEQRAYRISRPFISLRTGNATVYLVRDLPSGGSVAGELSLDALRQKISATKDTEDRDVIFVLDQYGMLLAHPSPHLVQEQTNQGSLEIFRQGMNGNATLLYQYNGTLVLGSATRVARTGWVVVDQVPVTVAFGPFALIFGLTLSGLILIWVLLGWNLRLRLHKDVVGPLEELSRSATSLAEGDYGAVSRLSPEPGTFLELERLAQDFRHMNRAVMERQAALEQSRDELLERNVDLRKAYGQLEANEEVLRKNYRELQDIETALRQSEQRFIDIISHLPDATFAIDRQHRIIAWNHAMEDMVGIPAATILGRDGSEASIPIYSVKHPLLLDLVLDNDEEIRNKYPGLRKEGDRLITDLYVPTLYGGKGAYVWLIASPLYDTEGNVTGAIESIRDITERRRAEEAVKTSGREWQTTFDAITDPVFLMDDQMRIVRHNHALETFLKKTADEIDGRLCHEIMHGTGYPVAGCPNVKAHTSRKRESLELKIGDRWFVASVDPVFSDIETITGCVHILVDITDRKRAEEALDQARRKLNLLNAITFSDIRNAVFSLSGYLQLEKQSATEGRQPLRFTDKETGLVSQISDSIQYAEIYQSLGLKSPVWQQVSQSFLLGISHLDISRLSRKLDVGSVEIFADPMLEKVFFALADNVVQHAPAATGYSLSCRETPEGLIIFFEDNGPGVSGDLKEKIFEREFGRRKGIGLYLSREILSVTGMSIRETGEPGKGARFEILVPKGGFRFPDKPVQP